MPKKDFEPVYIQTFKAGLFPEKIEKAFQMLEKCHLCPRSCGINRLDGERGVCKAGYLPEVSSYSPHFGEERPLVGFHGSGTIFMTHCNLRCLFTQMADGVILAEEASQITVSHEDSPRAVKSYKGSFWFPSNRSEQQQ